MRAPALLLAAALLTGALTGCTSSGPDLPSESAFAEGTCRAAAPDVLAVGRALPELGDGGTVADEVRTELTTSQDRLAGLAENAEPAVKAPLDELVVGIGLVRIRADGGTYDPELGEALERRWDALVAACT